MNIYYCLLFGALSLMAVGNNLGKPSTMRGKRF